MPTFTTTTTIEALPPMSSYSHAHSQQDSTTLPIGGGGSGARQRIRLMRSNMKLSRSTSATASELTTRSHSPAPSTLSTLTTTTTKVETLPIGPRRSVAHGVTHRQSGSGLGATSNGNGNALEGSPLRRQGSVFTGLHLTLVDDVEYSSGGDDLTTYVHHANRTHAYTTSTSSTPSSSNSHLPLTRSFAAGRSSRESARASPSPRPSPRPKPLSLDEPRRSINNDNHRSSSSSTTTTTTTTVPTPKTPTPTPTPLTPSFRFLAPALPEMRAQKMRKLARQLGESVPEELVFAGVRSSNEATRTSAASENREWTGVEVKARRRSLSSAAPAPAPASSPSPAPTSLHKKTNKVKVTSASKWEPPSSWLRGPSESEESDETKARAKDSWMGAWNAEDHEDVMQKLRALR